MNQKENSNILGTTDCYIDQFRTLLRQRDARLLRFVSNTKILVYYFNGINESEAVDRFIESRSQLL